MYEWRQYAFGMSNTFCELDSPRAPSISKHKQNLCHAQFAWRPKWATAEQVHKGAHTYKPCTMHCIHAPHAHSRTVLRTSHMDACAIQCAHSLFNTHVRLEKKSNSNTKSVKSEDNKKESKSKSVDDQKQKGKIESKKS